MKKKFFLFFSIIIFFTVKSNAQITKNVTKENNLTIVKIKTDDGNIRILLPTNIHAGDIISGTVIAQPKASEKPQKTDNKKNKVSKKISERYNRLKNNKIKISGIVVPVSNETIKFKVPEQTDSGFMSIQLIDNNDNTINDSTIPIDRAIRGTKVFLQIPEYLRAGYPQKIAGTFDGDLSTSTIKLADKPLPILAESPEMIVIAIPDKINGAMEMQITEGHETFTSTINIINLQLSADKLQLSSGESTTIHLNVLGLIGIEKPVTVLLENLSKENITLQKGNYQEILILPEMVNENGSFSSDYQIKAIRPGGYSVSAEIAEPKLLSTNISNLDEINSTDSNKIVTSKSDTHKAGNDNLESKKQKKEGESATDKDLEDDLFSIPDRTPKKKKDKKKIEICGFHKTKWIENKKQRSFGTLKVKKIKRDTKSTCPVCKKKHITWSYWRVTYVLIKTYEKKRGICKLKKGHTGKHKDLKVYKTKNVKSRVFENMLVKRGSCGDELIKSDKNGWIPLEVWKKKYTKHK